MKVLLTSALIGYMCLFGTKLKLMDSNFKEIAPGVASGFVETQFKVLLKSNGNKKITIDQVWLKRRAATWQLTDLKKEKVSEINDKETYILQGKIKTPASDRPMKGEPEALGSYEEEFVVLYKVDGSAKKLCIDKIENLEQARSK